MRNKIKEIKLYTALTIAGAAIMFSFIVFAFFQGTGMVVQERICSDACLEEGWPTSWWKPRNETCYCKNKLKAKKLYTGEKENE